MEPNRCPSNDDEVERREREAAYKRQQKELRRKQQEQLRDLQESLEQSNRLHANFVQKSLGVWREYFRRLSRYQGRKS